MADMTFDGKVLTWGSQSWAAVSGPWGYGTLPAGTYRIERRRVTPYAGGMAAGFNDSTNKGYFVPITPTNDIGRSGFGIHPDGDIPGTQGCIGITASAGTFYAALARTAASAQLSLEVRY